MRLIPHVRDSLLSTILSFPPSLARGNTWSALQTLIKLTSSLFDWACVCVHVHYRMVSFGIPLIIDQGHPMMEIESTKLTLSRKDFPTWPMCPLLLTSISFSFLHYFYCWLFVWALGHIIHLYCPSHSIHNTYAPLLVDLSYFVIILFIYFLIN